MEQQALQLYATIFNDEVPKDFEYLKVLYSTFVHTEGLRALLVANLQTHKPPIDHLVIKIFNYGIHFYKDAIEYPSNVATANPSTGINKFLAPIDNKDTFLDEEDDITNLKPPSPSKQNSYNNDDSATDNSSLRKNSSASTRNFNQPVFKNLDEELRLQLILNILKILRTVINSIQISGRGDELLVPDNVKSQKHHELGDIGVSITSTGKPLTDFEEDNDDDNQKQEDCFVSTQFMDFDSLFESTQWFLNKLFPNMELPDMSRTSLIITKEIIYLVYDYLMTIKAYGVNGLQAFNKNFHQYIELFVELLYKTHPKHVDEEIEKPAIRLSLESLIRIFYIIALLNSDNTGYKYDMTLDTYYLITYQFIDILKYNLMHCHSYSPDLFHSQIMNESMFHWFTGNMLNFSNTYINNKFMDYDLIKVGSSNRHELGDIFDRRLKEFRQLGLDNFTVLEFLPINLYMYNLLTHLNFVRYLLADDLPDNSLIQVWCCLLSYFLMYQYKSKHSLLTTKISLLIIAKLIEHEDIEKLKINEFDWKLCRQRTPIIPLNTEENHCKPLLSYLLDDLLVLIRYNVNRKLNIDNFINAIKITNIIIHKQFDEHYNYGELIKSCVRLLTFNQKHIHHSGLMYELLLLLNNGLLISSGIKFNIIYELLLNFETINEIPSLTDHPQLHNFINAIEFCKTKFDLLNNDNTKINLLDSDVDSPELVDAINSFEPVLNEKGVNLPTVNINLNEIIKNI